MRISSISYNRLEESFLSGIEYLGMGGGIIGGGGERGYVLAQIKIRTRA